MENRFTEKWGKSKIIRIKRNIVWFEWIWDVTYVIDKKNVLMDKIILLLFYLWR